MEFTICPGCEEANPVGAQKCQKCGAELPPEPVAVAAPWAAEIAAPQSDQAEPPPPDLPAEVLGRVQEIEDGLAKNPNAKALYVKLAKVYEDAGRKDLAIQAFERCLTVDPTNVYARHRLQILSGAAPAPLPQVFQPAPPPPRRPLPRGLVIGAAVVAVLAAALLIRWLVFPSTRRLVGPEYNASSPKWSPAGDRLAFLSSKGGQGALQVYDFRKKTLREVARLDAGWGGRAFAWSPDGLRIAYVTTSQAEDGWGEAVYVVHADGGESAGVAMGADPSWSPDGTSLLLQCPGTASEESYEPGGPCVVNVATGDVRRLAANGAARASFSPKDPTIVFEVPGAYEGAAAGGEASPGDVGAPGEELGDIAIAAQSGSPHNMAGASSGLAREMEARQRDRKPSISEAGLPAEPADIFVMGSSGAGLRQLTRDGRSSGPSWSPDGTKIFYLHSSSAASPAEIWMMGPDGSEPQPAFRGPVTVWDPSAIGLTPDRRLIFPAWVKNANPGLATVMTGESPVDLFVARVGEAKARRLENKHAFKQRFALSPDGKRLVYEALNEGKSELWLMSP